MRELVWKWGNRAETSISIETSGVFIRKHFLYSLIIYNQRGDTKKIGRPNILRVIYINFWGSIGPSTLIILGSVKKKYKKIGSKLEFNFEYENNFPPKILVLMVIFWINLINFKQQELFTHFLLQENIFWSHYGYNSNLTSIKFCFRTR